jgi:hypothetical protein
MTRKSRCIILCMDPPPHLHIPYHHKMLRSTISNSALFHNRSAREKKIRTQCLEKLAPFKAIPVPGSRTRLIEWASTSIPVGRTRREPVRVLHGSGTVLESLGQTYKEESYEIFTPVSHQTTLLVPCVALQKTDVNSEELRVKVTKKLR